MADSKKYDGSQWEHSLRKLTTATEAVENPLYSDGTAITNYTIKGNTETSGTPTPSNPITINGVGNKTANLFDTSLLANNYNLDYNTGLPYSFDGRIATLNPITYSGITSAILTYRPTTSGTNIAFIYSVYNDNSFVRRVANNSSGTVLDLSDGNKLYVCFFNSTISITTDSINDIMLNAGSTALPYEPYGYKIPISSGQGTAVNYLGSVQSTRQIKKLVLTGSNDENWFASTAQSGRFGLSLSDYLKSNGTITSFCSHYTAIEQKSSGAAPNNSQYFYSGSDANRYIFIVDERYTTAADFKAYLAQQYANGTPVTVWYVLVTEETGIVNEPLMKIVDYADTLSNATAIPTTEGANSITVDTTVQPSEFTATWTGWHDASVKEYDGSDWQ